MSIMTNRRQALAGLLATPLAGACAPRTAPPIDGTFLDTGDGNFNNPNNWSGKVVPTGIATIDLLKGAGNSVTFSQQQTTLQEIRLTGNFTITIQQGQSVTLGGAGLLIAGNATAFVDGQLNGAVVVRTETGWLMGSGGTVQGNVTLETGYVVPGTIRQGAGTLTIVGGYTQVGGSLVIRLSGGTFGLLDVRDGASGGGRATISGTTAGILFDPLGSPIPWGSKIRALATTKGLTGRFPRVTAAKADYDANTAYLYW
jgi:hypothetical protein